MTEADAEAWILNKFDVSRETHDELLNFIAFLRLEAESQNLVAASTLGSIWHRHIVDSAQLLTLIDPVQSHGEWLDLGSGAGFPGIVVALLSEYKVTLVESRHRRIDYLKRAVALLDLEPRVTVAGMPLERLESQPFSIISARAFAPLPRLLDVAARFSTDKTLWLLPKGRNAAKEWAEVKTSWNGDFAIEPSVTEPDSGILVGHLTGRRNESADAAPKGRKTR